MLSINDLQPGVRLRYNNKPYQIIKSEHIKMAQSHGIMRVKMRNLLDDSVLDETFKGNQTLEEVSLERKQGQFLYCDENACHFMDPISFEQLEIGNRLMENRKRFLKEGETYQVVFIDNQPVDVDLPIKVTLKVMQAPPGVRGGRAQAGTKQVVLENGLVVNAPLHIKQGQEIVLDTRTGDYVGRA